MNLPVILRFTKLVFKLRLLIALGVLVELAVKRAMRSSSKRSKKNHLNKDDALSMLEDVFSKARGAAHNIRR